MEARNPNQEWTYERADPSVGIFGEGWIHCVDDPDASCDDVKVEHIDLERLNDQTVRHLYKLTCPSCGATAEVTEDDWEPTEEALAEMERDSWDSDDPLV